MWKGTLGTLYALTYLLIGKQLNITQLISASRGVSPATRLIKSLIGISHYWNKTKTPKRVRQGKNKIQALIISFSVSLLALYLKGTYRFDFKCIKKERV